MQLYCDFFTFMDKALHWMCPQAAGLMGPLSGTSASLSCDLCNRALACLAIHL